MKNVYVHNLTGKPHIKMINYLREQIRDAAKPSGMPGGQYKLPEIVGIMYVKGNIIFEAIVFMKNLTGRPNE